MTVRSHSNYRNDKKINLHKKYSCVCNDKKYCSCQGIFFIRISINEIQYNNVNRTSFFLFIQTIFFFWNEVSATHLYWSFSLQLILLAKGAAVMSLVSQPIRCSCLHQYSFPVFILLFVLSFYLDFLKNNFVKEWCNDLLWVELYFSVKLVFFVCVCVCLCESVYYALSYIL